MSFYKRIGKRLFDLIIVIPTFVCFSPIILLIMLVQAIKKHSDVFFVQPRVGMNDKIFKLMKFCTMTNERDAQGKLLSDEKRITRFGNFLRKSSLDELPQLLNVIKGDMSLVGPRPLLIEYLPLYNNEQKKRHNAMPGITGWAQVNGRNAISWEQKFEYDVWYVNNQSFLLDIKILLLTVKNVLLSKNISQQGQATMLPFTGTKNDSI